MFNQIKKVAISAALQAGKILKCEYEDFDREKVSFKSKHEIVTRADLLSEEIIIKEIKKNFPAHGILSEEMGEIKALGADVPKWLIDPIDGTTNFSMHNPLWCISIGVGLDNPPYKSYEYGEIVLGVIYAPVLDELFVAQSGRGAFLGGRELHVSKISDEKPLNTFCHGKEEKDFKRALDYYRRQKLEGFDCRQLGSAAIELAYVAAGRIESIMIPGANIWDVAAGVVMVREAGGRVTDFNGKEWNSGSRDLLATNGKVHNKLLAAIKG
jgi:myo-inositol-1(or 4)-monophosphatase